MPEQPLTSGQTTDPVGERDINGAAVNTDQFNELWGADPDCIHDIKAQLSGGVKCVKCLGWCCY